MSLFTSSEEDSYYPEWLYKELLDGSIINNLNDGLPITEFLDKYTLHDSYLIGLLQKGGDSSVCIFIRFDPIWTNRDDLIKTSQVSNWPILIIEIGGTRELTYSGFEERRTLGYLESGIGKSEIVKMDDVYIFTMYDHIGGKITIQFTEHSFCFLLNRDGISLGL